MPEYGSYVNVDMLKHDTYYSCRVCEVGDTYFEIKTFEGRIMCPVDEVSWEYNDV